MSAILVIGLQLQLSCDVIGQLWRHYGDCYIAAGLSKMVDKKIKFLAKRQMEKSLLNMLFIWGLMWLKMSQAGKKHLYILYYVFNFLGGTVFIYPEA